jgi:tetratricopeptide (TPR) repeat protein
MVALCYFAIMKKLAVLLFLLVCTRAMANKVYEFNTVCQQAYKEIIQLKLNSGIALIEKAKQQNPDNLVPLVLESYVDFMVLFFNEDPAEFALREPRFTERINLLKEGPESSPLHRFCIGAVYLHKAAVEIKFNRLYKAGWDFRDAHKYIKDNKKVFPTFAPNDLLYGGLQAAIGTVPNGYKWLTSIFGLSGSLTGGMKTVKDFVNSRDPWARLMHNEACFMYGYLQFYLENKKDEALQFIKTQNLDVVNNHLFTYMAANLAMNNKQTDYAQQILQNRNKSADYMVTPVWDFQMGFVQLHQLHLPEAAAAFETFLRNFKGKFYVKDVYQKLSWCYYLMGNNKLAEQARQNVLKKGATNTDADKHALKDAKKNIWPNALLLKVRMLNDGGYNPQALTLLKDKTVKDFTRDEEQLEFLYRTARIYDDMGNDAEAIKYYQQTIAQGETSTEYYAARAALQTGMIYEKQGNKATAITYYQRCLNMPDHDYKNSLDQRAKSGLARCKGQ